MLMYQLCRCVTLLSANCQLMSFQGLFPTLCFYNVSSGQEQTDASGSFVNEAEAQFVTLLLSVMMTQGLQATSVGVITLYKAQARRIVNMIRHSEYVECVWSCWAYYHGHV